MQAVRIATPKNLIQVFDVSLLLRQVFENGDSFRTYNY